MSLSVTIRRYHRNQSSQRWADISIAAAGGADANALVVRLTPPAFGGVYGSGCGTALASIASRLDMLQLPTEQPTVTEADPWPLWRTNAVTLSCNTEGEMQETLAAMLADLQDNLSYVQGYPVTPLTVTTITDQ